MSRFDLREVQCFVSSLADAKRFYGEVLGLELRGESGEWLVFDLDGVEFVILPGAPRTARTQDYGSERATVVCLGTRDIDREYERMRALGVRFLTELQIVPQGKFVAFEDPDGNLFELVEK